MIRSMKRRLVTVVSAALISTQCGNPADSVVVPQAQPIRVNQIPASAEIVFQQDRQLWVMDRAGTNVTQITFDNPREYEHVDVSRDRRFMIANEQLPNPTGEPGGRSVLWLFDLQRQTERRLLPNFITAGNGGVVFSRDGYIYFAAKEANAFPNPRTMDEHIQNAGANDVYRMRPDESGLQRLTRTPDRGEADVGISEDGTLVSYMALVIRPPNDFTEISVANADGSNARVIYTGGAPGRASVHDPELSPDKQFVVFSKVNPEVQPNFPENPAANTAHDIYRIAVDGSGLTRLTAPGPISITPHWKGDRLLYLDLNDATDYLGLSTLDPFQQNQTGARLRRAAAIGRWLF